MTPRNGLTLTRYRVVLLAAHLEPFTALVEELDTGRSVARCYTGADAEAIARALEFATTPVVGKPALGSEEDTIAKVLDMAGIASPLPAPLFNSNPYRVHLPTDDADKRSGACLFEYKHSEAPGVDRIVARMVDLYNADAAMATPDSRRTLPASYFAEPRASDVTESLVALLRSRDAHGRAKYGTTLDRTDLDFDAWGQHLLEELLDAAGYVQAARRELAKMLPQRCDAESLPWIGFCSLTMGHAGDHAAHSGHDTKKRCLGTWPQAMPTERDTMDGDKV